MEIQHANPKQAKNAVEQLSQTNYLKQHHQFKFVAQLDQVITQMQMIFLKHIHSIAFNNHQLKKQVLNQLEQAYLQLHHLPIYLHDYRNIFHKTL